MNNKQLKSVINQVIETIEDNRKNLEKIKKIDDEVYSFDIDFEKLIGILKENQNREICDLSSEKILIQHYGNPYLTVLLCIEALVHQTGITIGIDDLCFGVNKVLIKIINDSLKDNKLNLKIELINNFKKEDIEKSNFDKIIVLGNSNAYSDLSKINNTIVKNVPFFSVALYYDSDEFYDLVKDIVDYTDKNYYEIEVFDDEDEFEDCIYMIKNSNMYCSTILSKDENKQKIFKQEVQTEILCINENPFKCFKYDISGKIF